MALRKGASYLELFSDYHSAFCRDYVYRGDGVFQQHRSRNKQGRTYGEFLVLLGLLQDRFVGGYAVRETGMSADDDAVRSRCLEKEILILHKRRSDGGFPEIFPRKSLALPGDFYAVLK